MSSNISVKVDSEIRRVMHHTIKEVTYDLDHFQFNTAISRLMEFVNALYLYTNQTKTVNVDFLREALEALCKLLGPFSPHLSEELWEMLGHRVSLFKQPWVQFDEAALQSDFVTVIIQINGKLIERLSMPKDSSQDDVFAEAMKSAKIMRHTDGKTVRKKIHIPNRILNLVI
ncbi:MAG: class I tRNA ligase family protein [Candidatus Electryoneaceae bacterium]|nr:class I tRNA ligase family protein [Candidatus Electryoneaceae bacterium]